MATLHRGHALAPEVELQPQGRGLRLLTPTTRSAFPRAVQRRLLQALAEARQAPADAAMLAARAAAGADEAAALLYALDRLGLLVHGLSWGPAPDSAPAPDVGPAPQRLLDCMPLRAPGVALPDRPPASRVRLSPLALLRAEGGLPVLACPGAAARLHLHDRRLLPLLADLAAGTDAAALAAAHPTLGAGVVDAVLAWMAGCELLVADDAAVAADATPWAPHEAWFHARTRRGFARVALGKTGAAAPVVDRAEGDARWQAAPGRLTLPRPDKAALIATDPPHAAVVARRRSTRWAGDAAPTLTQLSEFLFRTLHDDAGRRPYPSGGGSYALQAWLAVGRCEGLAAGLHAYDARAHALLPIAPAGAALDALLADAAAAAGTTRTPQVLLLLTARAGRIRPVYGDLAYGLVLKEVGAVMQTAALAAAAMGLGACPLGCGDAPHFAALSGTDARAEPMVGEMLVGTL